MPIPTNPEEHNRLKGMITEIANCMFRIDSEREQVKAILEDAADEYDLDKKQLRRIATALHKANYTEAKEENEEFEYLYESILEGKRQKLEAEGGV
jgi:hypothetical protein